MSSNIPTLSDIIASSPTNSPIAESPVVPGSRRSSKRFSGARDHQVDEDDLETLRSLSAKRDELLERRKVLQDQVRNVQLEIANYDGTDTSEKLVVVRAAAGAGAKRSEDAELDQLRLKLNKLPVVEYWGLTLELLKLFQPHLQIEIESVRLVQKVKQVAVTLKYHRMFKFYLDLKIDLNSEAILDFTTRYDNIPPELSQAIRTFTSRKNISSVIYCINSYVRLLTNKINTWLQIFETYRDRYAINGLTSSNELINYLKLKNESVLCVSNGSEVQLNVIWKLQVNEFGEFESVIRCLLMKHDGQMVNYDQLLNEMIKNDGLYRGMCLLIDNAL